MADLNTIESRIQMISENLTLQQNQLNLHLVDCEDDINEINIKIAALQREDLELHQEIHNVSDSVDSNTARINVLESKDYQNQINQINNTLVNGDNSLQSQLEEMDEEHHNELHRLADSIDTHSTRLNKIEVVQSEIPEHVVLSESDYNSLAEPEVNKLYFIYEED